MNKNFKILHIIPTSYGGGVETAGKSFLEYSSSNYEFRVLFLKDKKQQNSLKPDNPKLHPVKVG